MDILPLLDEITTIARNGLNFSENPYDRERYERLLTLASQYYGQALDLPPEEVRQRLTAELGYITPKVGAHGAIFQEDGKILLVRRADDGRWCLPCGWVDPNESPAAAAVREVQEETGLEVRVLQLVNVYARPAGAGFGPHSAVAVGYLCEITGGELQISHESLEARYWRIEEVPTWHEMHRIYAASAHACWQERLERAQQEEDAIEGAPQPNVTGERPRVRVYTDGACLGSPGRGGWGAILLTGHQREEIAGGFRLTTNARMEMMAVIKALQKLRDPSIVHLYTDSKMIVNAIEQGQAKRWRARGWKLDNKDAVADADLWEKILELCEQHQVSFFWVKGHAGNKENQRCDRLSFHAARNSRVAIDLGFENTIIQRLGLTDIE
ncbi:MAG TPA: ribonuclease HI [Ktedonobacterales bacterium]|nr:ribonuclease HI [Ktedonobacterales bacterium]